MNDVNDAKIIPLFLGEGFTTAQWDAFISLWGHSGQVPLTLLAAVLLRCGHGRSKAAQKKLLKVAGDYAQDISFMVGVGAVSGLGHRYSITISWGHGENYKQGVYTAPLLVRFVQQQQKREKRQQTKKSLQCTVHQFFPVRPLSSSRGRLKRC